MAESMLSCVKLGPKGGEVAEVSPSVFKEKKDVWLPILGLGLSYQQCSSSDLSTKPLPSICSALELGYRHVDTASRYRTEAAVCQALGERKRQGHRREEVFVTSKLWPAHYNDVSGHYDRQCRECGVESLDLFLLHWPEPFGGDYASNREARAATWRQMELLYDSGRCRAVGVSNFLSPHLDQLVADCSFAPHVNQVQVSPLYQPWDIIEKCRELGIVVEGYSPLAKGRVLDLTELTSIGDRHGKSAAQVAIRWSLQHGIVTIPKASSTPHIRDNSQVFDFQLAEEEMTAIDGLNRNLSVTWDPRGIP